ncbi:methyltransferase [Marihabitans asiaticum]|uniref:16S rRNA m(2)G 1207 methyltransferase n=1 Tax=Marihabitans asiaticum TaxID=415218 RepID=A0A560WA69_9MICO|nr:methyltransferase [Marihabitans asiaticum]TWD14528.1 16S rRNA m(2)G 1207 methyltransferase [Marihabitans asiaticum]
MTEHYFSEGVPATEAERRPQRVDLGGSTVTVETAGGVFSPGGLDKATAILLDEVPAPPPSGTAVDLGCGWGPIALAMALRSPGLDVLAVDVNERALDLTRRNAASLGCERVRAIRPDDVPDDLEVDLLWSNPPIRVGKAALHELLSMWLPRLTPAGEAWLVVGKNLGADSLQRWIGDELALVCTREASSKGFRVLRVTH